MPLQRFECITSDPLAPSCEEGKQYLSQIEVDKTGDSLEVVSIDESSDAALIVFEKQPYQDDSLDAP